MSVKRWIVGTPVTGFIPSIGLLLHRVIFGGLMLFGHGWGKLMSFGEAKSNFPDPLGIGSGVSLALAIFAEAICSALVMLGLATRVAVFPLVVTMAVAALIVHSGDPLADKEPALMYLTAFALLFFTGPGNISLDSMCGRNK